MTSFHTGDPSCLKLALPLAFSSTCLTWLVLSPYGQMSSLSNPTAACDSHNMHNVYTDDSQFFIFNRSLQALNYLLSCSMMCTTQALREFAIFKLNSTTQITCPFLCLSISAVKLRRLPVLPLHINEWVATPFNSAS